MSGRENTGLDHVWAKISQHRAIMTANGTFVTRRQRQAVEWMRDMLGDRLMAALKANPKVAARLPEIESGVRDGRILPTLAVDEVLALMGL